MQTPRKQALQFWQSLQGVGMLYENCNAHAGNRRKISCYIFTSHQIGVQLQAYVCMYFKTLGRRTLYEKIKIQGLGLQLINQETGWSCM
jgi:hypothetical protein